MQQVQAAYDYPRTYTVSLGWMVFFALAGTGFAVAGGLGVWYFGTGQDVHSPQGGVLLVIVSALSCGLGLLLLAYLLRSKLVLYADRIELYGLFSVKQMSREQIEGWRVAQGRNSPSVLVLVERNSGRKLQIANIFRKDAALDEWMRDLSNLDVRDRIESEKQIDDDIELGSSKQERRAALRQAQKTEIALIFATIATCAWGLIYPRPYVLAVGSLVALPWLALFLAWRSHGLFRVDKNQNDAHPTIAIPFIAPGFILTIIIVNSIEVLGVKNAVVATVVLTLLLAFGATKVDPTLRTRFAMMLLILAFSVAYGFGAAMAINVALDRSSAETYPTAVISQDISRGRSTTYYLVLEPWGPKQEPDRVSVPAYFYRSVAPGETVCVWLRRGALDIAWYTVGVCR